MPDVVKPQSGQARFVADALPLALNRVDRQRPGAVFGPETFVERVGDDALGPLAAAGDFASVGPNEPATHGWMVAVRARGPGYSTRVPLLAVESGRSVLSAANPGWPDIAVTRTNETMIRVVVVFVEHAV